MNRLFKFLGITMILVIFATCAYAGVFGTVKDFVSEKALEYLIVGVVTGLGMLGITWKLWGLLAKESVEFGVAIYKATREGSPGGKQLTGEEMEKIITEGLDIVPAAKKAILATFKKNQNVVEVE